MSAIYEEQGNEFNLPKYVIHNMERFRKHVRYSRPDPHILLRRVARVYVKYFKRLDEEGVPLFTPANKLQWKEYLIHVKK
jgi:hypothetical protein